MLRMFVVLCCHELCKITSRFNVWRTHRWTATKGRFLTSSGSNKRRAVGIGWQEWTVGLVYCCEYRGKHISIAEE